MEYADGVKEYRLWDTTAHKLVISRDVIFVEDKLHKDSTEKENPETTTVQVEEKSENEDSSEVISEHEEDSVESEVSEVRRSTREKRTPS